MNRQDPQFGKPKQAGLPLMIFASMFGHAVAILVFLIVPGLLSSGNPEPFGGSGPGGNVLWVSSSAIGQEGKPAQKQLTQEEPAPAQFIKKATEPDEAPLESKTEFPEPQKKKPKDEPTAKETLNQRDRKIKGEYGKGHDVSENSGKSGSQGKGKTGVGIGIGGSGDGSGTGTGTGIPFPYPWYVEIVKTKIELNWRKPFVTEETPQEFVTTVYFVIQRNGQVSQVKSEVTSGITSIDRSCESAILGAAPFPPLPTQWTEPNLAFRLTFRYTP
jgi:outer membrane biosynthesis protein TonB